MCGIRCTILKVLYGGQCLLTNTSKRMGMRSYPRSCGVITASCKLSTCTDRELIVREILDGVRDPVTNLSISSIGILQRIRVDDDCKVHVDANFIVPGFPFEEKIVNEIENALSTLAWVNGTSINCIGSNGTFASADMNGEYSPLSQVSHIVGVSSCKGGVGKSTVAAKLAVSLASRGLRTGLLDADIYGPSLPLLLEAQSLHVARSKHSSKRVLPLAAKGFDNLKILSFGHVNPNSGAPGAGGKVAATVRGPIASRIINQLLLGTEWGELDYLIIDMPPGTGDIQITLSQSARLSGTVMVTTPHALSLVDAAKGVAMFEELKVPTLVVVENMAYFECVHGTVHYPFGKGGRENLLRGCATLAQTATDTPSPNKATTAYDRIRECPFHSLPLSEALNASVVLPSSEAGGHLTEVAREMQGGAAQNHSQSEVPAGISPHASGTTYKKDVASTNSAISAIADDMICEIFKSQIQAVLTPSVVYSRARGAVLLRYFTPTRAQELCIPLQELRSRDPISGAHRDRTDPNSFFPADAAGGGGAAAALDLLTIDFKGHYGVAFTWSDGHYADIFSYEMLRRIAEECAPTA